MSQGSIISLGSVNADFQVRVDRLPDLNETLLASDFLQIGEGCVLVNCEQTLYIPPIPVDVVDVTVTRYSFQPVYPTRSEIATLFQQLKPQTHVL